MTETFRFRAGTTPLLVSMPHVGTHIPAELASRMTPAAAQLDDTDWHVDRLYDFLDELGASVLAATHSRYVIDLNRPRDGSSLYPGKDTIGLVPLDTAHCDRLYAPGDEPAAAEIAERVERYWDPYHAKLAEELARIKAVHGHALLWDAHSIVSVLPRFFEGKLPDLNLGTAHGAACSADTGERLLAIAQRAQDYRAVLNGRYVGGYITRRHGRPQERVQAVQLELAQCTYMEEARPYRFREDLAQRLRPALRALLEEFLRCGSGARSGPL
jgi:N-formylglutamate deformylase